MNFEIKDKNGFFLNEEKIIWGDKIDVIENILKTKLRITDVRKKNKIFTFDDDGLMKH